MRGIALHKGRLYQYLTPVSFPEGVANLLYFAGSSNGKMGSLTFIIGLVPVIFQNRRLLVYAFKALV